MRTRIADSYGNTIGTRYEKLVIAGYQFRAANRNWYAVCECDCGSFLVVQVNHLNSKTKSRTTSCGCGRFGKASSNLIHGEGTKKSRLYRIWCSMKRRCFDSKCRDFRMYGAKGIRVCEEWNRSFVEFKHWAESHGYDDSLTIDRIDSNRNYEPHNCQWLTLEENSRKAKRELGQFVAKDHEAEIDSLLSQGFKPCTISKLLGAGENTVGRFLKQRAIVSYRGDA